MYGMMDILHDQSLPTIGLLQASFPNNYKFMINISTLFDPRYVFLIYAPILFAINKRVGHRMIIALTWAEWANQILKWLLAGERPYWYVHERANQLAMRNNFTSLDLDAQGAADQFDSPIHALTGQLKQFPVTCELGAGSPSGHAMVTATVWYILIDAFLKNELQLFQRADYTSNSRGPQKANNLTSSQQIITKIFWSIYTIMLLLVSLSRVYLACHFPHQCLAGALLGCLMARFVANKLPMDRLTKAHFCLSTFWMFASALATYGVLRMTGFDPLWSVGKAMRWCVKSEYIHMDTTPFFSMMRYLGFCLGAGLAYNSSKLAATTTMTDETCGQSQPKHSRPTGASVALAARRMLVVALAVTFGQLLLTLPMPKNNQQLFYASSFLMYTLFSYAIAGPIPNLVKAGVKSMCSSPRPAAHLKQM